MMKEFRERAEKAAENVMEFSYRHPHATKYATSMSCVFCTASFVYGSPALFSVFALATYGGVKMARANDKRSIADLKAEQAKIQESLSRYARGEELAPSVEAN